MIIRRWALVLAACALTAGGARGAEKDLKQTFDELLSGMSQEQAQQKWQEICWNAGAPGHESLRSQACELMAGKLGPSTPAPTRIWLLKQLERIGRGECVDGVAAVVADNDRLVRDAAIRALANNPDPAAGNRLRQTLIVTEEPAAKVALLNAIGYRAETESLDTLAKALKSDQPSVVIAAARGLGRMGTKEAAANLLEACNKAKGDVRLQIGDALLRCGETMLSQGKSEQASIAAKALYSPQEPARLGGLELLLKTAGNEAPALMLGFLERGHPAGRQVVLGFVSKLDGKAIKTLADGLPKLPPEGQVGLLQALGARRDRAALAAVTAAAASDNPAVKTAALAALSGVGDCSTVPLLVRAIEKGGNAADMARHSLEKMFADGVDQALIDAMKETSDRGRRALYIEILDQRRAPSAVLALLQEVASDDGNVRRRAIAALGNVASPEDVAGLIRALLKINDAGERDEAGRAIAAVCARASEESRQADPVLEEYQKAATSERLVLLPVLGRIGGAKVLKLVREALTEPDPRQRESAQQALYNWPDSAAADDLASLAESSTDRGLKDRAIQELARVVILPGHRGDDAKLALLARAMKQAERNQDKRMILDRVREVHNFAAVRYAAGFLDQPKLASQVCATIADLLHREEIRNPNQAEADKIIDRVIAVSKDKSLVERVKSFKSAK